MKNCKKKKRSRLTQMLHIKIVISQKTFPAATQKKKIYKTKTVQRLNITLQD